MRLGVIDNNRPDWVPELVSHLDGLGYSRYWATEQHSSFQSGSPTIMTAIAAGLSGRMRVGTAGVLLNFYSPLKVAEDFRLLQLMFANRIDLGIAGAQAAEPMLSGLLDGRPPLRPETYAQKVRRLVRIVRREPAAEGEVSGWKVGPRCGGTPDIWLCGTSPRSAQLAAELGICYAFHDRAINGPGTSPQPGAAPADEGPAIVASYVKAFRPHRTLPAPRFTIACYGICARTSTQAEALWQAGRPEDPLPGFCGTPDTCRAQLDDLARRYQTDELIVQSMTVDFDACLTSYSLLASACGLA